MYELPRKPIKIEQHPSIELTKFHKEALPTDVDKLTTAAYFGDIDTVKDILNQGIDPDVRDSKGGTALCRASAGNYDFAVDFSNTLDPEFILDSESHRSILQLLVDLQTDIKIITPNHKSPLMYASFRGYPKTIQLLLDAGADVNQQSYKIKPDGSKFVERIPLIDAMVSGIPEAIDLLIEHGADPHDLKLFRLSDLAIASALGRLDVVIELLSSTPLDQRLLLLETRDRFGATPLIWAAVTGRTDIVGVLLKYGAKVNAKDAKGRSALLRACPRGHFEIVKLLVDHGADSDLASRNKSTPLMWAACRGRYSIMKYLLEHGAQSNVLNDSNATPLYRSAAIGHTEGVKLLLQYGASDTIYKGIGMDPVRCARNGISRNFPSGFKDILSIFETQVLR